MIVVDTSGLLACSTLGRRSTGAWSLRFSPHPALLLSPFGAVRGPDGRAFRLLPADA